jgi:hypothetical protein
LGAANSERKLLANDIQALSKALVSDAQTHGENWSPTSMTTPTESLHLKGDMLRAPSGGSQVSELDQRRRDEYLDAARHLIHGVAERLLAERLHDLYCFSTMALQPERVVQRYNKLSAARQNAITAFVHCLDDVELADARQQFKDAAASAPDEVSLHSFVNAEYAESYWQGVETITAEYISDVREYLASLSAYGDYMRKRAMKRRYVFMKDKRNRLTEQIQTIVEQLDGARLHRGKEQLRRNLESQGTSSDGHSDSFVGRILGRKKARQDKRPDAAAEESHLEAEFEAIAKAKRDLQTARDRGMEQIRAINMEFSDAGITPEELSLDTYEPDSAVLLQKKSRSSAQKFARIRFPLQQFVKSLDISESRPAPVLMGKLYKLLSGIAPSKTLLATIEVTRRLVQVYAMDPERFLSVCLEHRPPRDVQLHTAEKSRTRTLDQWLKVCLEGIKRKDYTVEYYLSEIVHMAPERFAKAASDECNLLLGTRQDAIEIAQQDAKHEGQTDRRLSADHRQAQRRQGDRRTNVIEVDFDRRGGQDRRHQERRTGSRRGSR